MNYKRRLFSSLSLVSSLILVACQSKVSDKKTEMESDSVSTTEEIENSPAVTCVGDFESASSFLMESVVQPLLDTSIVLKSTPKSNVVEILTAETFIEKTYKGIRLDGYITFEDDQLQKLNYAYFYNCSGLNDRLSKDSSDLLSLITSKVGEPGLTSGEDHTAIYFWDLNDQTIALSFYNDGYSLSVFPCI